MTVTRYLSVHLAGILRRPSFWLIIVVLALITIPHYEEALSHPAFLSQLTHKLGMGRHAFERIMYLAPIVWAGFLFGWKGAFITSLAAMGCMIPRIVLLSPQPVDSAFEAGAVFIVGNVLSISFASLRREREYRTQLEEVQERQRHAAEELEVMQENLRHYLQQAISAQEEERKRISHELHDDTIQALVVLSRQLDALASGDGGLSEENRRCLEDLWQQTDSILRGVRRLSQDLRPAAIDRLGLLPALEWLASSVTEYSGIAAEVSVTGNERRLPEEVAISLFRITQEALRNVWRHSGAKHVEIKVEFAEDLTRVTVIDDGCGFELPEKLGDLARTGKLGLAGMQERAQLVGGTLAVRSGPGQGTSITVELPG